MGFTQNSQPTSPALLSRVDSAVALPFKAREMALQHMNQRRHITLGRLSAAITPDHAIFDDTHTRTYFSLHSASEDVIYHSQAEYVRAQVQRAAPLVSSPVTINTYGQTYDDLPNKTDQSCMTSSSGEKIYHSCAEWIEAQSEGSGVSSPTTLDSFYGQTYENISPREISPWSTHEPDTKLYTFNDHKVMFEIFEEEKEEWSLHGQTFSNLPTSSSDLPPWSIRESERTLYNFDTHRRCMKQVMDEEKPDSGYEADTEDNTDIDHPEWYSPELSRENFDFQEHVQLSQIFEAEKELLKADERLREIHEKIRLVLAERDEDSVMSEQQLLDSEETEFEESDFLEQLQDYQPSPHSSPYSAPHDSEFSAASEMPSLTSGSGSVATESEKDWSPVNVEETDVLRNVEIGEVRETSGSE